MTKILPASTQAVVWLLIFINHVRAENNNTKVLEKKIVHGKITSFVLRFGASVTKIQLPKQGANIQSFAIQHEKWNNNDILVITLDDRGQVPTMAYYDLSNERNCMIGEYALLSFDKKTSYVIEPQYSSASQQIINRYRYSSCKLTFYDQLSDEAILYASPDLIKRRVTRIKGGNLTPYECDYEIWNGDVIDEKKCFSQ